MRRSAGVTVNAVFALAGSMLTLGFGVLSALALFIGTATAANETPQDLPLPPVFFKAIFFLVPLMYVLPAVWGICTSIGLLRLKNWARISISIFAGLLTAYGLFGAMGAVIISIISIPGVPSNQKLDAAGLAIVRTVLVILPLSQLALGIWWLVFFNRRKTRVQFQPPQPVPLVGPPPPPLPSVAPPMKPTESTRPVSVIIIAAYLLMGCAYIPAALAMRAPAVLFTALLTGWTAFLYYLALLALLVYVGVGLLRMQPAARMVAMAYFVFTVLNTAVFYFAPGGHARVNQLMAWEMSRFPWLQMWQETLPMQLDLTPFIMVGIVVSIGVAMMAFYFLFLSKAAFYKRGLAPAD